MLPCQKHQFSLPDDIHYLNGASMSPLSRTVEEAGIRGLKRKSWPHTITQDDYFSDVHRLKTLFAQLVHGTAERIAIIPSVSYGMAIVAKNLKAQPGQEILLVEGEFPSDVYAWEEVCEQQQLRLKTVARTADGPSWNEAILKAITEQTALVVIAPLHWSDGTLFDTTRISQRCREMQSMLVIDGTQSVGALPLDLTQCPADALIVAGYKWINGSYGLGLAYFGPAFDDGISIEQNWINREGSNNFRSLMAYTKEFRPAANRYSMGEQSNFIQIPMLIAALEQILEWTPEAIQAYCQQLIRPFVSQWQELGFRIEEESSRASHLFGLSREGLNIDRLRELLAKRHVYISTRGNTLRIATYVYNTPADLQALTDVLRESVL